MVPPSEDKTFSSSKSAFVQPIISNMLGAGLLLHSELSLIEILVK